MMDSCPGSPVMKNDGPVQNGHITTSSYQATTASYQDDAAALKESLQENRAVSEKILEDYNRQLRQLQDEMKEVDDNSSTE